VRNTKFWAGLLAIVLVALALRVSYVAVAKRGPCPVVVGGKLLLTIPSDCAVGDQLYYNATANGIAQGHWFEEAFRTGPPRPAADHPPLTALVLASVSWLAEHPPVHWITKEPTHVPVHRYTMAVLGAIVVLLVGLLGRAVGGDRVGWIAAAIAALAPTIWVNDGLIFSETITNLCVVALLLVCVRVVRRPTLLTAAGAGALAALAMLARAELALLLPLLVLPVLVAGFGHRPRDLWRPVVVVAAVAAVLVGPWVGWNLARFDRPVYLSSNIGLALAGSNCDRVYSGGGIGLTSLAPPCTLEHAPPGDQSVEAHALQTRAIDYMKAHKSRVPVVMAARVGRTWSLFRPIDMVAYNVGEGRERWVTGLGIGVFLPMLGVALAGAVLQWRRRAIVAWTLLATTVAVTLAVALTYGQTRFRAPAEPGLAVLAAVALVALADRAHLRLRIAQRGPLHS
jgi:4-amino-4-deoxy-L-arabinose transferase-like glycosyltransferase